MAILCREILKYRDLPEQAANPLRETRTHERDARAYNVDPLVFPQFGQGQRRVFRDIAFPPEPVFHCVFQFG